MQSLFLPAVLSSSKSTPAPILSNMDGICMPPPIMPDMPPIIFEELVELEEEDIIVDDDEENDLELDDIILDPEDIIEPMSPPNDIISPPLPPIFMPSIIFFIMASMSSPPSIPERIVIVMLQSVQYETVDKVLFWDIS